jgi:hypothetical protein
LNVLPTELRWLFWDVSPASLDFEKHKRFILARVLEKGRLSDVRWLIRQFGEQAILDFMRHSAHPEISARTRAFWRAYFRAQDESWQSPPTWRQNSNAPWPA